MDVLANRRGAKGARRFRAGEGEIPPMIRTAPLLALAVAALASATFAQTQPAGPIEGPVRPPQTQTPQPPQGAGRQQQPRTVVTTTLVIVPVRVKDSHGQLVGDLTRDEFRVLEDDIERRITTFSAEPVPISAVVLLQNDLAEKQAKEVQQSLVSISAGFGPNDEVAMMSYDQFPNTVLDFSKDNDKLFTQLKRFEIGSHSTFVNPDPAMQSSIPSSGPKAPPIKAPGKYKSASDLDDALYAAGQLLKDRGRDRRKIIFLITDGSNSKDNKHPFADTSRSLLQSDIAVFAISVQRSVPIGKSLLQRGASAVDNYAKDTGGDTFYAAKADDLERLYSNVTEEARNEYTLTFQPDPADRTKDFHAVEVRVTRPGLDIRTRNGYYLSSLTIGH